MSSSDSPQDTDPAVRLLACGRDPVEVVDRARAGSGTEHERTCPWCRAAIEGDDVARRAAAELAEAERANPVPATLLPNVMRGVWSDLRRSTMISLTTDAGSASVADHTIAAVIENALDRLTDLRIHTCSASLASGAAAASAGGTIAIAVRAAAAYNADVRAVAAEARAIARRTLAEQFGWAAEPVDIEIVDVYVPGGGAA